MSSIIPNYNIEIRQNADFDLSIVYSDDSGDPINLSNTTAKMQIREKEGGNSLFYSSDVNGDISIQAVSGQVDIHIPKSITSALSFQKGYYDIVLTWPGGATEVFLEGEVTLRAGVTK